MKIKTITCHDVYNIGASLQAYALQQFLSGQGHEVEIINYKPDYLRHYRLWWIPNPRFDRPVIRTIYKLAKFPGRLRARLTDPRKKAFDLFTAEYLRTTKKEYHSCRELCESVPEADLYIAGSDQIWNPVFENGKDPSFFLQFAPKEALKYSYAASFSVDEVAEPYRGQMKSWLTDFDRISVRETSGLAILSDMGLTGIAVCDPVFLLEREEWQQLIASAREPDLSDYLLVYDFDGREEIRQLARKVAAERKLKLVSVFSMEGADRVLEALGPVGVLRWISQAGYVISNSFHATAFSLVFHREFLVVNRTEKINTRMRDLLASFALSDRLVDAEDMKQKPDAIDWHRVDCTIRKLRQHSKEFLNLQGEANE